jgi:hypothetical protein
LFRPRRPLAWLVIGFSVFGVSACSDDDGELAAGQEEDGEAADEGPSISLGSAPTTTLPSCPADTVEVPGDWPFAVPAAVSPTATSVADLSYSVTGITNDPERVLVDSIEQTFAGFTSEEPTGDPSSLHVAFASTDGEAALDMRDDDGDGCWEVALSATYPDVPPPATDEPQESATTLAEAGDDLAAVTAVGQGQVVTARGTYQLMVTRCDAEPLAIAASGPEGDLSIEGDGDKVRVVWIYADGVEIADDEALVMGFDQTSGTFVADGDGPNGEETVIADFVCS